MNYVTESEVYFSVITCIIKVRIRNKATEETRSQHIRIILNYLRVTCPL
jgi:hypothetical protein